MATQSGHTECSLSSAQTQTEEAFAEGSGRGAAVAQHLLAVAADGVGLYEAGADQQLQHGGLLLVRLRRPR